MTNPYESPNAAASSGERFPTGGARRFPAARTGFSVLMLMVGVTFLLLLNGQVFTNGVIFIALATLSMAIWLSVAVSNQRWRFLACWIILGHVGMLVSASGGLRKAYEEQSRFNGTINEIRNRGS